MLKKYIYFSISLGFLVFINLFCVKYGAIALQELIDSIQPRFVFARVFTENASSNGI